MRTRRNNLTKHVRISTGYLKHGQEVELRIKDSRKNPASG